MFSHFLITSRRGATPPCLDIERVTSLQVLGVIVNNTLTAADHATMLLSSYSSLLYAMQILRSHSMLTASLHDVFRAVVVSHIPYAAPAWSGMTSASNRARLDLLLCRRKRLGYCSNDVSTISKLFNSADDDFFHGVKTNSAHVLQPYLPEQTNIPYHLCTPPHNMTIINKTKFLNDRPTDFIIRMLYKHSYTDFHSVINYTLV